MINEGTYRGRATGEHDVQFGFSKNGNEQIAVLFALVDESGAPTGERITWIGFFTDKTKVRTFETLRLCGMQGDSLMDLSGIAANEVDLVVRHEEYEGKTHARIAFVNAAGTGGGRMKFANEMTQDQRAEFARRMRGELMSAPKPGGSAGPANRTSKPMPPQQKRAPQDGLGATGSDDDIPF